MAGFVILVAGAEQASKAFLPIAPPEQDPLLPASALAGEFFTYLLPNVDFSIHAILGSS